MNKMNFVSLCLFVNIFNLFKFNKALPMEFCFITLNTSDCELPPTPVFTYYKPGSRCEIELWRGCPTYNKFENEFECSHACIGRLNPSFSAENNEIVEEDSEQCKEPINLDDCGMEEVEVYTFNNDKGYCETVAWRGCETANKFEDKDSCKDACRHLMKDETNSKEETETEEEEEDEKKSGSESAKSTDKTGSEKTEGSEEKKTDEEETKDEEPEEEEKKDDEEEPEKLKKEDDEDEGDPEETSSVRRSGNQTLSKSVLQSNV